MPHNIYKSLTIVNSYMEYLLPQEIQVRYVLPAIRGEMAKAMVDEGMSQREAARMLGMTEGAISQYLSGKRANYVVLGAELAAEVRKSAGSVRENRTVLMGELIRLSNHEKALELMCRMHKETFPKTMKGCNICFE